MKPLIGITTNRLQVPGKSPCHQLAEAYSDAVTRAGGLAVLLPAAPETVADCVDRVDALVLTGGDDPDTTAFGQPLHPRARLIDPMRQAFETQLLRIIDTRLERGERVPAVLGVCLGMQMMALVAGGHLAQYMPESHPHHHHLHTGDQGHGLTWDDWPENPLSPAVDEQVVSSHRQCVADPGKLRVVAWGPGDVIEAVADPRARFSLGVQWHPERGGNGGLSAGLWTHLVRAAGKS